MHRSGGRVPGKVAALALLLLFAFSDAALAHANYVRSVPEADARLARRPTEVRVSFSERPEPRFSEIQVLDASGARVDSGDVAAVDDLTLRVSLKPIEDGGYTVAWKVLSAVDGHETRGAFVFAVGNAPLPSLPDVGGNPTPSALEIFGRILTFGAIALLLGAPLFALVISRSAEERAGISPLVRGGALTLLAGTALLVVEQAQPLQLLFDARLGRLFEARALLAVGALALPGLRSWLVYGVLAAVSLTAQSHAAATGDAIEVVADVAHVLAVSAWAGGLAALAVVALPRWRAREERSLVELGALVGRFSVLGVVAVTAIVATGTVQSLNRLVDVRDLIETSYGLALLAKIALLAAAVALAALNLLRHGPALRKRHQAARARRLLDLGVRGEIALVVAILVAAGVLTALAPPSTATGASYAAVEHSGGLRVELRAQSSLPGQNRYVVRLQEGLAPPRDVEKVSLRFTMVEHDMGEQELVARERAPGEYVADGSPTSMFGTWRVNVVARRTQHEEGRAVFTVPVAPPPGSAGATTARALQAGALTLIVFSNPSLPLAGQPLALSIVVIDPNGNPVASARVIGSLEGKTYAAVEEAAGRYRIELSGLGAGQKTLALKISSPAGGGDTQYQFSVSP